MVNALETIFLPFDPGALQMPAGGRGLFAGARYHPFLSSCDADIFDCVQFFRPYAADLEARGFAVVSFGDEEVARTYGLAMVLCPKNSVEARYFLACAARRLEVGGVLVCAADNKAGGTRLKKFMQSLGFEGLSEQSKHKARVCWGKAPETYPEALQGWLEEGAVQPVLNGDFVSQPGVFGWDKIDKGSALLMQYLPDDLKGRGGDFGCGYGYLSRGVLDRCSKARHLTCIDADRRAVEACRANLRNYEGRADILWEDLAVREPVLNNLDFIVMNPPFHEGKDQSAILGQDFIRQAHGALKRKGRLFMVANAHLPYEEVLRDRFFALEKLFEGQGFKVFAAVK